MPKHGKAIIRASAPVPLPKMKPPKAVEPIKPPKEEADEEEEDFVPEGLDADPLSFLCAPKATVDLFRRDWERRPVVIRATEDRRSFFEGLFDYKGLLSLAEVCCQDGPDSVLQFGSDVNAARYVNGVRETPNGEVCDMKTLRQLYKQGCTFQLIQPQRFSDVLWRLLAALERQLGCLVGCNAYITPSQTQGLAPHCDDVEIFVCQTQGSKRWRLYKPLPGCELASVPSGDLAHDMLGEPTMDVTLEVGDVLYMPRGTIHQAVAHEGGSSHLTLSTYQRWNHAELLIHLLRAATSSYTPLEAELPTRSKKMQQAGVPAELSTEVLPRPLLEALPPRFLFECGLQAELLSPAAIPLAAAALAVKLAGGLRSLANVLERPGVAQPLLTTAADNMAADFIRSRLPPHPAQLRPTGPAPTLEDAIMCRGEGLFLLVPVSGPPDQDVPEGFVQLCTCLHNDRDSHMIQKVQIEPESDSGSETEDEGGHSEDDHEHQLHGHHHPHGHHHRHCRGKGGDNDEGTAGSDEEEDEDGAVAGVRKERKQKDSHGKLSDGSEGSEEEEEDEEEEESEDEEGQERGPSSADSLPGTVFPGSYAMAIAQILGATCPELAVTVSQLRVPSESSEEALRLAYTLWHDGYLCTVPKPALVIAPAASLPAVRKGGAGKPQRKDKGGVAGNKTQAAMTTTGNAGGPQLADFGQQHGNAPAAQQQRKRKVREPAGIHFGQHPGSGKGLAGKELGGKGPKKQRQC